MKYYLLSNELEHHGIKGQKWGIRRFQNKDGTYTALGRTYRNKKEFKQEFRQAKKEARKSINKEVNDYKMGQGVLKNIYKTANMGKVGSYNYNRYRANGDSRVKAYFKVARNNLIPAGQYIAAHKAYSDRAKKYLSGS